MRRIRDPRAVSALLAVLKLNKIKLRTRCVVVESLGVFGNPSVFPLLTSLLKHSPHESMRNAAAKALGDLKDKRAIPVLIERMKKDSRGGVRGLSARALGMIGDIRALRELLKVSEEDSDEFVREEAVKALRKLPSTLIRFSANRPNMQKPKWLTLE